MTQKARWHALWRAISENVLAASGETACIVAIHIGAMFLASPWLDLRVHVSDAPWILSLVGAVLAVFLVVEVSWVKGWVTTWLMVSGSTVEPREAQERA